MIMSRNVDLFTCLIPVFFQPLNSLPVRNRCFLIALIHMDHMQFLGGTTGRATNGRRGNEILSPIIRSSLGWPATLLEPVIGISGGGAPSLPRRDEDLDFSHFDLTANAGAGFFP